MILNRKVLINIHVHIRLMVTKTITIMEDAYEVLAKAKLPNESFSDTIRRVVKPNKTLSDFAGIWKDVNTNEIKKIIEDGRKRSRKRAKWIEKQFA